MKKLMLAVVAAATLTTASLAPSSASAHWVGHGGPHWNWGGPFYGGHGYGYGIRFHPCYWSFFPYPHKVCFR